MAGKDKKGNAFTNNPIVRAVGTQKIVVLLVIIVLALFFCIASDKFRQYSTFISFMSYSYYISFMAIGVTFALITGGVDLSIGTGMICYSLLGGFLVTKMDMPVWVGMIVTILIGCVFGIINGILVAVMNLPAFIATLGTMMVCRGLGSIFTGGMSVTWPAVKAANGWFRNIFKVIITDNMPGWLVAFRDATGLNLLPTGLLLVILLVIVMSIVLNKTRPGRYIIAIGSNREATRLSGVNVVKWQMLAYIISGTFAGLAGVAYGATFQSIGPGTGAGLELDAIASAIIGGTSMSGGVGTITGTLLGVYIMSLLKTGLPYIGLQANWQQIVTGGVLIVAIFIDVLKNKKTA